MKYHRQQTIDPHALGQQHNLGSFKVMCQQPGYRLGLVILLFFIACPLCLSFTYPGSILLVLGLCLLLIILFCMLPKYGKRKAFFYDDGFICAGKGNIQDMIRWTDVESFGRQLEGGSPNSPAYTVCSVTRKNGESFKLSLGRQFIKLVEVGVVTHLYPSVQAVYLSGEIVHFGRLDLSQEGLYDTKKKTMLVWSEVESIHMSKPVYGAYGYSHIRKRGKKLPWASIALGELKDTGVLHRLIDTDILPVHSFAFKI